MDNGDLTNLSPKKGALMSTEINDLKKRIEQLEQAHEALNETLKTLLPMAIAIPASTQDSGQAIKELKAGLAAAEEMKPRSEEFWYLASAMAMLLSSKAQHQHPDDPEVLRIYQGIRAHRQH